ncbi:MAG TPA: thioredoxin family protein [Nakamurella sp.]|jgi:thioredoxin 1|nr:thioredoxin family protein [Nakamurella sp.]
MSAYAPPAGTVTLTADTFQEAIDAAELPVLVEFTADWCPPCRAIAPVLSAIATERAGSLTVAVIDSDAAPQIGARYGVLGLPTLILFRDGTPLMQLTGARPKHRLDSELDAALLG